MKRLWLDLETYSEVPISNGTHRYAQGAEVLLFAWAIDDGPVSVWDRTADPAVPPALRQALEDPDVLLCAHNSHFDRTVLRLSPPFQAARAAAERIPRWRDTMVKALCHGLPGALGDLCRILRVPADAAKDKAGRQLVLLFTKPRPASSKLRRATRHTHPAEWERFVEYAALDIEAMRAVDRKLPEWNYRGAELALWHRDQAINDRGVAIDGELVDAAVDAVASEQQRLATRTGEITAGALTSTRQRDATLEHVLAAYGVALPDLQAATLERRLTDPDLPPELRELLALRLSASTTSAAKYKALARATCADGRLRGALQYSGAARTRRWAGRLFQPQNLPRPSLPQREIEQGIAALKAGAADIVTPDIMRLAASALRGCIVAPAGRRLVVSDLSNIEGRVAAWLAGEDWKLRAFRAFDAGEGPDLYALAYAKSFNVTPDSVMADKKAGGNQRQVGKVQELMLQYEGGVGAFITGAATYSIDLDDLAERAGPVLPAWARREAQEFLAWCRKKGHSTHGLRDEAFIVCDALKRLWREAHGHIVLLWAELDGTAIRAAMTPGHTFQVGRFKVRRDGAWLRILLPSGNYLCYPNPGVEDGRLTYEGVNQYTRKWERIPTYGGKLFENCTQSLARDVMAANMPAIEQAGFDIVLTVHDEVITEAPDTDAFDAARLSALLATNPPWAPDLPLAAGGFQGYLYRKD